MGTMLLFLGFLAFFINPLKGESFQFESTGYNGENEYHTVNVNEQVKIAVFNVYSGRQSANAVFDYSQNIVAYQMPYKGICVLAHMDIATFPGLGRINEWIHTKREQRKDLEELRKHYFVTDQQVNNLAQYGNAVQSLCWGIPTYWAREYSNSKPSVVVSGGTQQEGFICPAVPPQVQDKVWVLKDVPVFTYSASILVSVEELICNLIVTNVYKHVGDVHIETSLPAAITLMNQ